MKHVLRLALIAAMLAAPATAQEPDAQALEARAKEAKAVIKRLVTAMQAELKVAKDERGPGGAVSACQHLAPQVAADLKEETGWDIRRTALKVRNPENRPRTQELLVLQAYAARAARGEPLPEMETVQTAVYKGERGVHFMKAIPVQKACLGCHGSKLAPGVAEALREAYPEDQAVGFAEGDLRGAFSLFKPVRSTE
ncbi:MAG: DUF3365 domain-containing protein [Kiloniellales bacterium]|nr:DUF3365 domain-containing protein [Kiloniellales bacterium]